MRSLMERIKSHRRSPAQKVRAFSHLEKLVRSHMTAEERALLTVVLKNPLFEDEAREGIEEHRIHEVILEGIHRVAHPEKKLMRMKIFCEILEHHLDEEEEDLFPHFRKYAALSTRKKLGAKFVRYRKATDQNGKKLGALAH